MNKNSNKYTFIFASVMVVIVAVLLSLAAIGLGPYQARNIKTEKMQNILASVGVQSDAKEAEKLFSQYVKEQVVLNTKGQPVSGITAFDVDLKKNWIRLKQAKQINSYFLCSYLIKMVNCTMLYPLGVKVCGAPFGDMLL